MTQNKKEHWETVFTSKAENEVSWYQKIPEMSLQLIEKFNLPKDSKIIDVGGGDSYLIDVLLEKGYSNLYLLDISEKAIERIKERLGEKSKNVTFIVSSNTELETDITFDLWHDRASFHFLTQESDVKKYAQIVSKNLSSNSKMILATFSENGPKKCSGLDILQYSSEKMNDVFKDSFELIESFTEDHKTPFETIQNFIFCTFNRK